MLSRWIVRFAGISTICLAVCAAASAQYGGGGATGGSGMGATGGTPAYVAPSGGYGSGKAIGIGVGAAAGAAVAVLLVRHHHHTANNTQAYLTGCTQFLQNGISLTSEKDYQTYTIVSNDKTLKVGERVMLKGSVVSADGPANPSFQAFSLVKDFGSCGQASTSNFSSLSLDPHTEAPLSGGLAQDQSR
jgi:hypothetical protein